LQRAQVQHGADQVALYHIEADAQCGGDFWLVTAFHPYAPEHFAAARWQGVDDLLQQRQALAQRGQVGGIGGGG